MEEARLTEQGPVGRDGEVVSGFLGFFKNFLFYHVFVCVCMMCVCARAGQKRASAPFELGVQTVLNCLVQL